MRQRPSSPWRVIRRLYDWTLSWAAKPHAMLALGALAFAESSFFPIPPDVLLIALALGNPARALRFASLCTVASVAGGLAGYAIGWGLWSAVSDFCFSYIPGFSEERFALVQGLYRENAFWAVFSAAFTPIPYKVFTIAGGVFGIRIDVLILGSLLGRGGRFFAVAWLIRAIGPAVKPWIDRYFNWLAIAFTVLLIGGFAVIKWLV